MAVQARADGVYDGTGGVDLTFGAGRLLQLVSSTSSLNQRDWLVPGMAVGPVRELAADRDRQPSALGPADLHGGPGPSLRFRSVLEPLDEGADPLAGCPLRVRGRDHRQRCGRRQGSPGCHGFRTLLVPYPHDIGDGEQTTATETRHGVRLTLGQEWVEVRVDDRIERIVDALLGYANRRGLCADGADRPA